MIYAPSYLFGIKPCSFIFVVKVFLICFQAIDARDALAKSIYACLFDWLVEQINKSLAVGKRRTGRSISILDIYGFESFNVCWFLVSLCVLLHELT
jgi:hypothetical protein